MLYEYFQSYEDYFWQWEDNVEVIAVPNAGTIVYRDYVLQILEKLSPQGLPRFGSLLLALVATNPEANQTINTIYTIISNALKTTDDKTLADSVAFLKLLSTVPPAYKSGNNRILLLQSLFQNCHQITSPKKANTILENYISNKYGSGVIVKKKPLARVTIMLDIQVMALLYRKFPDVETIMERIAGLPTLPDQGLELEKQPVLKPSSNSLLEELIYLPKTFPAAALVQWLWSGLNIPFHSFLPSQQPLGGVSDLTNKGDFTRLLISEFANDDLVFLSRLCNNEALYLNREIPPVHNNQQRIILLDVSLKNWGTPKTIAFALMLAIAKHPKTDIPCVAYAVGTNFYPIGLANVDEIIQGLQHLEGALHAASGLEKVFKELAPLNDKEIIIISAADALKDSATRLILSEYQAFVTYHIQTDAFGKVEVFKNQNKGKKHIQTIQVPLEDLWKKRPKATKPPTPVLSKTKESKPASLPLLFQPPVKLRRVFITAEKEIFAITTDRSLLRLYNNVAWRHSKGWELLYEQVPYYNAEIEIGRLENGQYMLFIFRSNTKHFTLLNIQSGEQQLGSFPEWEPSAYTNFLFQENHFYYLTAFQYWRINLQGEVEHFKNSPNTFLIAYKKRLSLLERIHPMTSWYSNRDLMNVQQVYINEKEQLVLNHFALQLINGSNFTFHPADQMMKQHEAVRKAKKTFVFADGSEIEIKQTGLAALKSSSDHIPVIYIPLQPSAPLGLASSKTFSGNEYYRKESRFDLDIKSLGPSNIDIYSEIKNITILTLDEARDLIEQKAPGIVFKNIGRKRANELQKCLQKTGCQVTLKTSEQIPDLGEISPVEFLNKYIGAFISHIKNHGTGN